jgi:adenylyl-sulfate kinase
MESNLTWTHSQVDRAARWRALGQRGVVVWLTGLSGSGKSTLAVALDSWLHLQDKHGYILDGDNMRQGLCRGLTFAPEDRAENIRRTGEAAKLLAQAGLISICSLISPYRADRQMARESCLNDGVPFLEVFVNSPLHVCEGRDPRGLYKKARAGGIANFTGIDSPYEAPEAPDVELLTDVMTPQECIERLGQRVLAAANLQA